jgi:hypothetical protein
MPYDNARGFSIMTGGDFEGQVRYASCSQELFHATKDRWRRPSTSDNGNSKES